MRNRIDAIREDGSLPFVFDRTGMTLGPWILNIIVRQFPTSPILIGPREIPDSGDVWEGFLTSSETALLDVSSKAPYYLIGVMTNQSTDEKQQVPLRFHVGMKWDG